MGRLLPVLLLLPAAWQCFASTPKIPALHDFGTESFAQIRQQYTVGILFSADCRPCAEMVRDLSCLDPQTKTVLLGIGDLELALRKTYQSYHSKLPAYKVSPSQFAELGGKVGATPQVWLLQSGGVKIGKIDCQDLKVWLAQSSQRKR